MGYIFAIIIGILVFIWAAVVIMMVLTFAYHLLYGIMPLVAAFMVLIGLFVGLWNAIKNTISIIKEVYGKK